MLKCKAYYPGRRREEERGIREVREAERAKSKKSKLKTSTNIYDYLG